MTRHLILHIGSPKCGSTYLQRLMLENQSVLREHGVMYPTPSGSHPGNGMCAVGLTADGIRELFAQCPTVVLSHEDLFAVGARLAEFGDICRAEGIQLTVLVFLRPFSEFIYGDYSQYLKQNIDHYLALGAAYDGQSFEEFAVWRRSQITPSGWLKAWQKVTDTPLFLAHHREIQSTLQALLGDLPLKWAIEKSASNPSLRVVDCEDIAEAIADGIPAQKIMEMYKLAYSKVGLRDQGKTNERNKWLEALFLAQNEKILEDFQFDNRRAA